jgi:hypothetical protein
MESHFFGLKTERAFKIHVYSESFRSRIVVNLMDDSMFRAGTTGHYKMGVILGHLLKLGASFMPLPELE